MQINAMHAVDGYKLSHSQMYQPGTEMVYSNFTPRSDKLFKGLPDFDHKMMVIGIQGFLYEHLIENFCIFFRLPGEVKKFQRRVEAYLGPDKVNISQIQALYDLGYLPLKIKALKEGSRVPMGVPILTITNTLPEFYWLVNYLETVLSSSIWKSCVNGSLAFEYRRQFEKYAKLTGSPKELVMWQGHDFSARGMSGPEDSARSGLTHLASFYGTDTLAAIDYAEDYYGADVEKELVAGSVPATEHAVATSNILFYEKQGMNKLEAETAFLKRYITEIVPTGIVSYVADSFDYYSVLKDILPSLKKEIMERDGKLVIRPDSGDPVEIICGIPVVEEYDDEDYKLGVHDLIDYEDSHVIKKEDGTYWKFEIEYEHGYGESWPDRLIYIEEVSEAEVKGSINLLWETFGGTITETGHKLLDSHIGLIYGDSITLERQEAILSRLAEMGFASANVVLGVGSYTYNYSTRDTFGSAIKATATQVNGEFIEIYKDPATGHSKKSAKGLLRVEYVDGNYKLFDQQTKEQEEQGELKTVFLNGEVVNPTTLAEIREQVNIELEALEK